MTTKNTIKQETKPKLGEELANAITHGIGVLLAIVGLVLLVLRADDSSLASFAIYGSTLILLYLASTLYHSLIFTGARKLFRKFDHMAIFLLIAGTYTPFCITALDGWMGWALLAAVWSFAILGIVMKSMFTGRFEWLSVSIYILTGWMVILAIKPIYDTLTVAGFAFLVAGGLAYTVGTLFYMAKRVPYAHSIWHLWVLAGSVLHYFSVLTLT